jgi:hypothetical protein
VSLVFCCADAFDAPSLDVYGVLCSIKSHKDVHVEAGHHIRHVREQCCVVFPAWLCVTQCAIASCVDIFCYVSHPTKSRQEAEKPQNRTKVWLGVRVRVRGGRKLKHQSKTNLRITLNRCHYSTRYLIVSQIVTTSIWHREYDTIIAAFAAVSLVRAVHLGDVVSAAAAAATCLHEMTLVS